MWKVVLKNFHVSVETRVFYDYILYAAVRWTLTYFAWASVVNSAHIAVINSNSVSFCRCTRGTQSREAYQRNHALKF